MKISFYGHACLGIQINSSTLLVDPYLTENPNAKHIDIDSLRPDLILITHAHGDHILDAEYIAAKTKATIISNFEITSYYQAKGLKVHAMNFGGNKDFKFCTIKYVNAIHTSSFPDRSYGGQPGGFVITANNKSIYIAGDTALSYDMKLIPLKTRLDLIVLPIGDNFTMGIDDAVIASDFLQCNNVLGYHYDTFDAIKIDHGEANRKFEERGKVLHLLNIGDVLEVG